MAKKTATSLAKIASADASTKKPAKKVKLLDAKKDKKSKKDGKKKKKDSAKPGKPSIKGDLDALFKKNKKSKAIKKEVKPVAAAA